MLFTDNVPIDAHLKEGIQFGGFQDGVAVLAGGDDSDLEPVTPELMNEPDASLVGQNPCVLYDFIYKIILPVPESADCFGLRRVVRRPFRLSRLRGRARRAGSLSATG